MRELHLPDSITQLVDRLQLVQLTWQGIPIQLPRFAVYAVVDNPVFDSYFFRNGRRMALIKMGKYRIPVIDPFRGNVDQTPQYVVIISHARENRFGLYAYPADQVSTDIQLPKKHKSIHRIVRDFV